MTEQAIVHLQGGGMPEALTIQAEPGTRLIDVVRELVRDGRLPLYWRCGQGTCGACLVYVDTSCEESSAMLMSSRERNVLLRMKLLSPIHAATEPCLATPDTPRLACHVVLLQAEYWVRW